MHNLKIGQKVFVLYRGGYHAKQYRSDLYPVTINYIGRKYFTVLSEEHQWKLKNEKFHVDTLISKDTDYGLQGGEWRVYLSEQERIDELERSKLLWRMNEWWKNNMYAIQTEDLKILEIKFLSLELIN